MLDRLLARAGIDRATLRIANVLCCRPPHNHLSGAPYEHRAIDQCSQFLREELNLTRPKVIVTMGNIPFRALTKLTGITKYRGFPVPGPGGSWIVPTLHPSYLLPREGQHDTARLTGAVILDLKKAVDIAKNGFEEMPRRFLLDPSVRDFELWAVEYEIALAKGEVYGLSVDIETPGKLKAKDDPDAEQDDGIGSTQIMRIGFAWRKDKAVSVLWQPEFMPTIRRLLLNPQSRLIFWNGYGFDLKVLRANKLDPPGEKHDAMWAWHLVQSDLPRSLESVASHLAYDIGAWKHLDEQEPALYNALDCVAALRNMEATEQLLRKNGMWEVYLKHVVGLYPFLLKAGREHGVHIDVKAQDLLGEELERDRLDLLRKAQTMVPSHLKTEKIYQREPKDKTGLTPVPFRKEVKCCSICGKEGVTKVHFTSKKTKCLGGSLVPKVITTTAFKWEPDFNAVPDAELDDAVNAAGFNPVSSHQMILYAKNFGHQIGENYKTKSEQLDRKVKAKLIQYYRQEHPLYELSQTLSEISKAKGTYVDGYRPDAQGRIYTTYTLAASTGRLTSRAVNLQNASRGSNNRYSAAIRRTIIPRPGHTFVEADSSAIEAVMTGFFQEDDDYIALARQGIHDYVTFAEFGYPWDPSRIADLRKDPKYEEARERNKRVVHGTNYGMTPKMMVMAYPDFFRTEKEATYAQARYFEVCPRLGPWQHELRITAHRQTYLINPWSYRHYFYDVFTRNKKGEIVPGSDAKRVVAFLPQSSAACFMKDTLLILADSRWAPYAPANVSIHDSICLDVPDALADEAEAWLLDTMTRPIPEMNNLRIGAECKRGKNWSDMKKTAVRKVS